MAESTNIFVDTDKSLDEFTTEVEQLTGFELKPVQDEVERWFEFADDKFSISVGEHDFENDREMKFENYRFHIKVTAVHAATESETRNRREHAAREIYAQLERTNRFELMMTRDLQTKICESHRAAQAA